MGYGIETIRHIQNIHQGRPSFTLCRQGIRPDTLIRVTTGIMFGIKFITVEILGILF